MEKEVPVHPHWSPMAGGTEQHEVAPEGFQLHMRKNIFTEKVVKHKQASQGLMPHACLCSRGIWTMPSVTCFPSKQTALFCVLFR